MNIALTGDKAIMLSKSEKESILNDCEVDITESTISLCEMVERAVLAKALDQQERLHKEWSSLWNPIDELVRPITPLGESVSAKAVELIGIAKAMPAPKQEPRILNNEAFYIIQSFYWFMEAFKDKNGRNPSLAEWLDAEGKFLLDKINCNPAPPQAAAIPEGWQVVPKTPTPAMLDAYHDQSIAPIGSLSKHGYKMMLLAAPRPEGE
jgi:hypothetical protein